MPLYDYECAKCGVVFEVRQKFSDEPLRVHENCGGELTKLLSAPAFQFKGTGWYVTDYAKGGSSPAPKSESDSGSGSSSSETKTTETKSAESKPAATPASSSTKSE